MYGKCIYQKTHISIRDIQVEQGQLHSNSFAKLQKRFLQNKKMLHKIFFIATVSTLDVLGVVVPILRHP